LGGRYETVIVGGGIAGLACARQLYDGGRSFLLVTEDVGGRIRTSADGTVNLGAYYVRGDYDHVNQFVDRGRGLSDALCKWCGLT
jgi:predicted NAD/FAD-dependent oxidoreductase